jgi:hypothetical protein
MAGTVAWLPECISGVVLPSSELPAEERAAGRLSVDERSPKGWSTVALRNRKRRSQDTLKGTRSTRWPFSPVPHGMHLIRTRTFDVAYGATELSVWRMQQQMIMVAHETIHVDFDAKGAVMSRSKARKTCR